MSFSRNIGGDFHTVGKADTGDFSDGGVRLARSLRRYARAYPSLERSVEVTWTIFYRIKTARKGDGLRSPRFLFAPPARELIYSGH